MTRNIVSGLFATLTITGILPMLIANAFLAAINAFGAWIVLIPAVPVLAILYRLWSAL